MASRLSVVPRRVGNSGASGGAVVFAEPVAQRGDGGAGEWGDPVAAFAVAGDACARAEVHVGAGEPDEFGDPQPGLDGEEQQRVVAAPGPGRWVAAGEERVDLGLGQVADQRPVEAFGGIARTRAMLAPCSG